MLKFYYNRLSPYARRVWLTLIEKNIPFEAILIELNGDQLQPEFLAINPFHHIPVVVDEGVRVVESLAIMDYLEAKYPTPSLLPKEPGALATVRMAQMVTNNELSPHVLPLFYETENSPQVVTAKQEINKVFNFLTELLGNSPFFGSEELTLGDIIAGNSISILMGLGISLNNYPSLDAWYHRLMQREAWQKTQLHSEDFAELKRRVQVLVKLRRRELNQKNSGQ
jgi:glutathione S-transferase